MVSFFGWPGGTLWELNPLYAIAIVLTVILDIPLWGTVLLIGVTTVIYDTLGGMAAVVYSDVVQPCQPNVPAIVQSPPRLTETRSAGSCKPSTELPSSRKQQQRRRRGIAGCGKEPTATPFCAADKDIFIYRVSRATTADDITSYLEKLSQKRKLNLTIKDLKCVSHADSAMKSFRLTVSSHDFVVLMNAEMWPPYVRVRRFIHPRAKPC